MIARLLAGAARSLFTVAVLLGLAAALAGYGAYRLLRAATVGAPARPKQAAALGVLVALVELGRTMIPRDAATWRDVREAGQAPREWRHPDGTVTREHGAGAGMLDDAAMRDLDHEQQAVGGWPVDE